MPPADEKLLAQIRLILGSDEAQSRSDADRPHGDGGLDGAAAFPPNWREVGKIEYMYREYSLLVRTADLSAVQTELNEIFSDGVRVNPPAGVIQGVTRLSWTVQPEEQSQSEGQSSPEYHRQPDRPRSPTTPEVLDGFGEGDNAVEGLDSRLGVGVARPDHVLFLCGHPCPATEPEEVPQSTVTPFPAPSTGLCCEGSPEHPPQRVCDGHEVFVSVVDSGLIPHADTDHPWLAGVDGEADNPLDPAGHISHYAGHGTFVAGCVRCTAPKAAIYVESTPASEREKNSGAAFETTIARKISDTLARGPDIIVCEYDGDSRGHLPLHAFDALYESRIRPLKGLAFLAPAGNDSTYVPTWPAAYPWVIGVGALSANWRQRAHFSNYGGWVDVYAPGEDLVNAFAAGVYVCNEPPNNGVQRTFYGMAMWSGTSFSTPLVAGLIAARMSATGENARQAADSLLRFAHRHALPGVGPVLLPDQAFCEPEPRLSHCSCHSRPCV
jgi:hypothetical protein